MGAITPLNSSVKMFDFYFEKVSKEAYGKIDGKTHP